MRPFDLAFIVLVLAFHTYLFSSCLGAREWARVGELSGVDGLNTQAELGALFRLGLCKVGLTRMSSRPAWGLG